MPSARCPDGETDIIPRFDRDVPGSTPGRGSANCKLKIADCKLRDNLQSAIFNLQFALVPSFSGQDVPLTWGRAVVRVHPGSLTVTEGLPDGRREPVGNRSSAEPCGFNSRSFRCGCGRSAQALR